MSKQLFIHQTANIKTGTDSANLADLVSTDLGKVVILDEDGKNVPLSGSTPIGKGFSIAQVTDLGADDEGVIRSQLIKPDTISSVKLTLHRPEQLQITSISNLPTSGQFTVKVKRLDKVYRQPVFNFSVEAGPTATDTADKIVDRVNKTTSPDLVNADMFVTASKPSPAVVELTGINGAVSFYTGGHDENGDSIGTITSVQTPDSGVGTKLHLKVIEEYAWSVQGFTNRPWLPTGRKSYIEEGFGVTLPDSGAGSDSTSDGYDVVSLEIETNQDGIGKGTSQIDLCFPTTADDVDNAVLSRNGITEATLTTLFSG